MSSAPTDTTVRPSLHALTGVALVSLFLLPALAVGFQRLEWYETNLLFLARFLTDAIWSTGYDSWLAMDKAHQYLSANEGGLGVYQAVFFRDHTKFQYPPTSLVPFDLLRTLFDYETLVYLLNAVGWFCALGLGVVTTMLVLGCRRFRDLAQMRVETAMCLVLCLGYFPLTFSQWVGQVQTMLSLFAGISLLAARDGRDGLAGAFVGLCCAFKPQYVLVLVPVVMARRWRVIPPAAGVVAYFLVLSLLMVSPSDYLDYLQVLSSMSSTSEAYYANQSIGGAVLRYVGIGEDRQFLTVFPPATTLTSTVSFLTLLAFVTPLIVFGRRASLSMQLAFGFVVATIGSPIAWQHHYGVMLPALGLGVHHALDTRRHLTAWLLAGCFAVASQGTWLVYTQYHSVVKTIAQLPLFLAGVAVFVLLLRLGQPAPAESLAPERSG